ncbi:nucleocapsid phosphoprotein [Porcine torovirus]|uniref:Nucleocapsid phosphoprotein n=1 Tax=Porcine torovirus TaxID=237020 RepID=A0A239QNX7_9NIDO|nr:nucleocapsid phosphoprotein [Porcine torovirus]
MNSMLNPNAMPFQPQPQVVAMPIQYPMGFQPRFRSRRNPGFRPMFQRRNNVNQNRSRQNRSRVQNQRRGLNSSRTQQRSSRRQNNQQSLSLPFEQQLLMMANETALSATFPPELQSLAPTKLVKIAKRAAMQIVSGHATVEVSSGDQDTPHKIATFTIKVALN